MKKRILFIASALAVIAFILVSQYIPTNFYMNGFAEPSNYSLVFNKDKNKFHNTSGATPVSGTATALTELGNEVEYTYSNIIGGGASTWHVLSASDSYFYNQDPLSGLYSIELAFKTNDKEFKIYWSSTLTFDEVNCETFTSSSESNTTCYFNGYNPNYVKVENLSGSNLNISNVSYKYSCTNQYYNLSRSSENKLLGTVSGDRGVIKAGTDVSISATPSTGYKFEGWYCNSEKISSENPYLFTMPYRDLNYIAKFIPQTYTLSLSSNDEIKGTVSGSGEYPYLSQVTAIASPNEGYELDGWYNGSTRVSKEMSYTFSMPYNNYSLTAKFVNKLYSMVVTSSDESKGTVSGSGSYLYLSSVTLKATPKIGCHFVGWFDDETLISSDSTYTFDMPYEDLNYVGKFEYTLYSLTVTSEDETKGTVSGTGNYIYQEQITLKATPKDGYTFFGWYKDDELLSRDETYQYEMPLEEVSIVGRFTKLYNLYIESDDETKGTVSYPSSFGEGLEVTVRAIPNDGCALNYWYNEDFEEVSYETVYSFTMPSKDVVLYANFVEGGYKVNVSFDNSKGSVVGEYNYNYLAGRLVTLTAIPNEGYALKGWYQNDVFISKSKVYQFDMPSNDYSLTALFWTQAEEEEEERARKYGTKPIISSDGKKVTYGLYPQKNVNDPTLISSLNALTTSENNGWYLYNDEYYAKAVANPCDSGYKFDNGTTIVSGTKYWFKCESIVWNILSDNNGEYYILSNVLLDAHRYGECYYPGTKKKTDYKGERASVYANNYKYSDIRTWLNVDFYNSAFALNNEYIQTTEVDNSDATTYSIGNPYACENTLDKVFLPSYKDYINSSYVLSTRYCKTTDWARARGAYYSTSSSYLYNGYYWTRSPDNDYSHLALYVSSGGSFGARSVDDSSYCVRPSLSLKIA